MKSPAIAIFLCIFIFFLFNEEIIAHTQQDSAKVAVDSTQQFQSDVLLHINYSTSLDSFLRKNKYLNVAATPVSLASKQKIRSGKEFIFYFLETTILILAVFKVFYSKYFNNIFRVFFNTSLRQNQLTDLLLQAKLPSLIFNIFFVISFGLYLWLLLTHYSLIHSSNYMFAVFSILFVAIMYVGKFISLKFMGWACGMIDVADQYIFVIFLINKIIGIILIPFIVLLAFAPEQWVNPISISSLIILSILFLLRYLRSYGLLQSQLALYRWQFLLYITAIEVVPVLIIYKLISRAL